MARVQAKASAAYADAVVNTTLTATLNTPATAGNWLVGAWAIDKAAGTIAPPSGAVVAVSRSSTSISLLVCAVKATGGETGLTASWTGTTGSGAVAILAEWSGLDPTSPFGPSHLPAYVDTNTQEITLDPPAATGAGAVMAVVAKDSFGAATTDFAPTATGFTRVLIAGNPSSTGASWAGCPGLALFEAAVTDGQDIGATSFTWAPGTADQGAGFAVQLREATPAAPPAAVAAVQTGTASLPWLTAATLAVALPGIPVAGRLVRACVAIDKSAGAWGTAPAGWAYESTYTGASVSMATLYRVSDGTEASRSVTFTWTTTQGASAVIAEYPYTSPTLATTATAPNPVDDVATTTLTANPGTATAAGVAFATFATDTWAGATGGTLSADEPTWTEAYTRTVEQRGPLAGAAGENGVVMVSTAARRLASGDATATTGTWTRSDQATIAVARYTATYTDPGATPPAPVVPAVTGAMLGAVTITGATLAVDIATSATARAVLSTAPALTSPAYGAAATGTAAVKSAVTGLTPDTLYHWGVEVNGAVAATPRGQFRTAPAAAKSFDVIVGACAGGGTSPYITASISNAPTFEAIATHEAGAAFALHTGDGHYKDAGDVPAATHVGFHRDVRATPRQALMHRAMPLVYHLDDHDGPGNNWTSTTAGAANAVVGWDLGVPHHPVAVAGTWAHTFTWGPRVRFVILDVRSKRVAGNMLGTEQRTWVRNTLAAATERVVVVDTGVAWIGDGVTGTDAADSWGAFPADRQLVAEARTAYEARTAGRVVLVGGDAHMVAIDSGANSQYDPAKAGTPGPPVFQLAPFDSTPSTKGGPWSDGTFSTSRYQYGRLRFTDDGATVTVVGTGFSVPTTAPYTPTTLVSRTVTVPPAPGPVTPPVVTPPTPTPTPTPTRPPTPPVATAPPWEIHPLQADLTRVADPISLWTDLALVERQNLHDTWIVNGPASALSVFTPGMGCVLRRGREQVTSGRVRSIRRWAELNNGRTVEKMAVGFASNMARLAGRTVWPDPTFALTSTRSVFPAAYDTRTDTIESLILYYIDVSIGPAALPARREPRLRLPVSQGRGGTTTVTARNDNLATLVHDLAEAGGLRVDIVHTEPGPWLDVVITQARDLSANVRFGSPRSTATGIIATYDYEVEEPTMSRAIVAGEGELAGRWYIEVGDPDAEALWKVRTEGFVDQRQTGAQDELLRGGTKALEEGAGPTKVAFTPVFGPDTVYRRDVHIGDVVGYDLPGLEPGKDSIREATTTVAVTAGTPTETVAVVVGTPGAGESRSQRQTARALRGIDVIQGSK